MGRAVAAAVAAATVIVTAACAAPIADDPAWDDPAAWIADTAAPIATTAADGPLDEVAPLREIAAGATVVGLGESAHGTHDEFTLRDRMSRFLVERMGFRTLAWENDFANSAAIDRYVVDGVGDPRALVGASVAAWRSEEMLALVEWVRAFNTAHPGDEVRILGTDVTQLRAASVEEITRYVAAVAPQRLAELHAHLDPIAPRSRRDEAQIMWFFQHPDQQQVIADARAVRDLVAGLPGGPDHDIVLRHAEAVLGFYVSYSGQDPDVRDRTMAETLTWWQRRTGHKVVYWAANIHVSAAPAVDYAFPPTVPEARLVPAGHVLRETYGPGYVPVATVFGSGAVLQGWENGAPAVYPVPGPGPATVDRVLGTGPGTYLLDLGAAAGPAVTQWRDGPATLRLIGSAYDPAADAQYAMRVPSLTGAFDAVAHVEVTGPAQLLG